MPPNRQLLSKLLESAICFILSLADDMGPHEITVAFHPTLLPREFWPRLAQLVNGKLLGVFSLCDKLAFPCRVFSISSLRLSLLSISLSWQCLSNQMTSS